MEQSVAAEGPDTQGDESLEGVFVDAPLEEGNEKNTHDGEEADTDHCRWPVPIL